MGLKEHEGGGGYKQAGPETTGWSRKGQSDK